MPNRYKAKEHNGEFSEGSLVRPEDLPEHLAAGAREWAQTAACFPMKVNAYVLSMIRSAADPIGRQFLPSPAEKEDADTSADPLAEESQSPAPQVIHRYPHRVLLLVSNRCAVHCRFCMRKRRAAEPAQISQEAIGKGLEYIRRNSSISEVILSGGDPLMLSDDHLAAVLHALRRIPHLRLLRLHTRVPGVWPQRVTARLARRLSGFHPIYINIHFNHPLELTAAATVACRRLADAGIPLGSQTVLLKGVNDSPELLQELMQQLLVHRIRPYYIHQIDPVPGTSHFRVPIGQALDLFATLRGKVSGMAVPRLMIDLPGGGGKVALCPDSVMARKEEHWLVRNWEGKIFSYPCS